MSTAIEFTPELQKAVEILESKLKSTFGREVTVLLIQPRIVISTFMHSVEVEIQLGNYKKVNFVSLSDISQPMLVHNAFQNIYVNFVYECIKEAAKRF